MTLDLNASYDNGYFDKDEQGWCARNVEIRHAGDTLTIRSWGDDNGARPYDSTGTYRIGEHLPALGLVRLRDDNGRLVSYFDLQRRCIRPLVEQEVHHFSAPPGYETQAAREALGRALAPLARALGITPGDVPAMPLPDLTPSPTAQGTLEAKGETQTETAHWTWMRRHYPNGGSPRIGPEQMAVGVRALGSPLRAEISSFVQAPEYANLVLHGSVELLPGALPLREPALAAWIAALQESK